MRPDRFGHGQVAETLPDNRYELTRTASKFEYANPSHASIAAMDAALGFVADVGLNRIARHTHALAGELRSELVGLGRNLFTPAGNPSSIVSCYHNLDPDGLGSALAQEGVRFTFQEEGKLLRLAVGMFNNRDDVDRLLRVIARMV